MSIKQYTTMLKKAGVPASEITAVVDQIANLGLNERFTVALEMEVIERCIQDVAFRQLFITQPKVACTQIGIKL